MLPCRRDTAAKQATLGFVAAGTNPAPPTSCRRSTASRCSTTTAPCRTRCPSTRSSRSASIEPLGSGEPTTIDDLRAGGTGAVVELVKLTHGNVSTDKFDTVCGGWIAEAEHPRFARPYSSLIYPPMHELIRLLEDRGFTWPRTRPSRSRTSGLGQTPGPRSRQNSGSPRLVTPSDPPPTPAPGAVVAVDGRVAVAGIGGRVGLALEQVNWRLRSASSTSPPIASKCGAA